MLCSTACLVLCVSESGGQGLSPEEAAGRMTVPEGLRVVPFASEPMVRQPVAIEFDDRGRLWVIQYLQYPNPAGLKRVKVDRYSRTVYDASPSRRREGRGAPIGSRSSRTPTATAGRTRPRTSSTG